MDFTSAKRIPEPRFTQLKDVRHRHTVNVQGVIVQAFDAERTAGTDFKSALLIKDPSMEGGKRYMPRLFLSFLRHSRFLSQPQDGAVSS